MTSRGANMTLHIGIRARAAIAVAAIAVTAACGSASAHTSGGHGTTGVVATARNASLGGTVLVNRGGMTLYTLSAERNGRFICTGTCTQLWKPLLVKGAVNAAGIGGLGTVMRPGGAGTQLTYQGRPLYTFAKDSAPGDATGNGFKDVGVWRAATIGATASSTAAAPSTSGGYGY
jgi:predicted lipoprotein with Yx(FWY)xxD motif